MSTLDFYRVECPKCHGQINSVAPLSGQTLCPFCGTECLITTNITQTAEMPLLIVPFATSARDFEYSAWKMLAAEDYSPVDIFRLISFENVKRIYLPVFFYKGKYKCTWSCKIKQTSTDTDDAKRGKEVFCPQNSAYKGEYSMVCTAYEGVEVDKELANYVRTLDFRGNGIRTFLPQNLKSCFFLIRNCDDQQTWKQWGEDTLNNMVMKNTLMQMQNNDIKDFKCNVTSGGTSEG